jgi:hypothetical protein
MADKFSALVSLRLGAQRSAPSALVLFRPSIERTTEITKASRSELWPL